MRQACYGAKRGRRWRGGCSGSPHRALAKLPSQSQVRVVEVMCSLARGEWAYLFNDDQYSHLAV